MNTKIIKNYSKLRVELFLLPILLLIIIFLFLYLHDALNVMGYIHIQKNGFIFINSYLGQFPSIQSNITQLGNGFIFLSFLSIFIIYAPIIWETVLWASIISFLFSKSLKSIFAIPRPAAIYDNNSFIIIGKTLSGNNSLPSGHSITIFTILTILMFAFMPEKIKYRILYFFSIITIGLIVASTRIGVGAHHPLDVIIGTIIGYISGLAGIFINRKYKVWNWINNKRYSPLFILLLSSCCIIFVTKIIGENLIIFYLGLISLVISLYKIIVVYKKNHYRHLYAQ